MRLGPVRSRTLAALYCTSRKRQSILWPVEPRQRLHPLGSGVSPASQKQYVVIGHWFGLRIVVASYCSSSEVQYGDQHALPALGAAFARLREDAHDPAGSDQPAWKNRLNAHDRRGITPLVYGHVNPYGSFQLDLNSQRLLIRRDSALNLLELNSCSDTTSKRADRLPPVAAMLRLPQHPKHHPLYRAGTGSIQRLLA